MYSYLQISHSDSRIDARGGTECLRSQCDARGDARRGTECLRSQCDSLEP